MNVFAGVGSRAGVGTGAAARDAGSADFGALLELTPHKMGSQPPRGGLRATGAAAGRPAPQPRRLQPAFLRSKPPAPANGKTADAKGVLSGIVTAENEEEEEDSKDA